MIADRTLWIPACAGMTDEAGVTKLARMTDEAGVTRLIAFKFWDGYRDTHAKIARLLWRII